jgi:hypothetical protein
VGRKDDRLNSSARRKSAKKANSYSSADGIVIMLWGGRGKKRERVEGRGRLEIREGGK